MNALEHVFASTFRGHGVEVAPPIINANPVGLFLRDAIALCTAVRGSMYVCNLV